MTRREGVISAAVAFLALALAGATVPQDSVARYYFSRPLHTNVTGTVMGSPPAYDAIRFEDVAWLYEAACERAALLSRGWWGSRDVRLVPTYGHFPLADSNRFSSVVLAQEWDSGRMVTNIVVGYSAVTNAAGGDPAGVDRAEVGTGIDIAARFRGLGGFSAYLSPDAGDWLSGSATIATTDGPPPLHTNIVTSVVTNWQANLWSNHVSVISMPMTNGSVSVFTNSWRESIPSVTNVAVTNVAQWAPHDMLFAGGQVVGYSTPLPDPIAFIPLSSQVTNAYTWLRGMTRVAFEVANTNLVPRATLYWDDIDGKVVATTNLSDNLNVDWGFSFNTGHEPAGNSQLVFSPGYSWAVVHTGGVDRIAAVTLYGFVEIGYSDSDAGLNVTGYHMANLGAATRTGSRQGGWESLSMTADIRSLVGSAAAALGVGYPAFDVAWVHRTFLGTVRFFAVVDFSPFASLPDWISTGVNP